MLVNAGDTVTFLEEGTATIKRHGEKAVKEKVAQGEVYTMIEAAEVSGVPMDVTRARPNRLVLKQKSRNQKPRHCSLSIATLEAPPPPDAEARRLEEMLLARGALLRDRLAKEAEKLKRG